MYLGLFGFGEIVDDKRMFPIDADRIGDPVLHRIPAVVVAADRFLNPGRFPWRILIQLEEILGEGFGQRLPLRLRQIDKRPLRGVRTVIPEVQRGHPVGVNGDLEIIAVAVSDPGLRIIVAGEQILMRRRDCPAVDAVQHRLRDISPQPIDDIVQGHERIGVRGIEIKGGGFADLHAFQK